MKGTAQVNRRFWNAGMVSICAVLFLILVGGIVRSTGAGMGCPDWPKCFGLIVPPSDVSELTWESGKSFQEGQMVIRNEQLLVAKSDLTASSEFNASNWEPYKKHNYAVFNAAHTWTEYVNRLVGVLVGFSIFVTAVFSAGFLRRKPMIAVLGIGSLLLTGFQGWIGAKVVDTLLAGWMVTIHMLLAFVILMMLIHAIAAAKPQPVVPEGKRIPGWLKGLSVLIVGLTLVQILLGTQVREEIDAIAESLAFAERDTWISRLGVWFSWHQAFYFTIVAALIVWGKEMLQTFGSNPAVKRGVILTGALVAAEILFGILLANLALPPWLQPLHLLFAALIFCTEYGIMVYLFRLRGAEETSESTAQKLNTELSY